MKNFDVKHFVNLARLSISDEKALELEKDFNDILKMIGTLEELELNDVAKNESFVDLVNVYRKDEEQVSSFDKREFVNQMPEVQENFLKVPLIIED